MAASIFDPIRNKVAGKPSASVIAGALNDLANIEKQLQEQHAEVAQKRSDTLLTADEASLAKSRAALGAIDDQRDVAAAFRTKLAADYAAALGEEEQARRREAYEAATAKVVAAKTFQRDFDRAARAMAAAMTTLMEAKLAATAANEFLPAGAEPIPDPEWALGCIPGEAKKVLREDAVSLWCLEGTLNPVPDQAHVVTGGLRSDLGYLPPSGSGSITVTGNLPVVRRGFLRREVLPPIDAVWADPISQTLCIPGWILPPMRGPFPLEAGAYLATISAMVASHDAAAAAAAKRKRVAEIELVPVDGDGELHEDQLLRGHQIQAPALAAKPLAGKAA